MSDAFKKSRKTKFSSIRRPSILGLRKPYQSVMVRYLLPLFSSIVHLSIIYQWPSYAVHDDSTCPCPVLRRPGIIEKELTARWMVHTMEWGVIATMSSRLPNTPPFGNVYSFVDGTCDESSGTPYFYGSYMDQTLKDMLVTPMASLTITEAALASVCGAKGLEICSVMPRGHHHEMYGDPESPLCARLTLTGKLVEVSRDSVEFENVLHAFYLRHPQMKTWPSDHNWVIVKLVIEDIWFLDYFGGATILDVDTYFEQDLATLAEEDLN